MLDNLSLRSLFEPPDGEEFLGGILTTYGLEEDLVRGSLWPAVFREETIQQMELLSQEHPAWLIADQEQHQSKPMAVGGWTVLCPREGRQHSKVWLLAFCRVGDFFPSLVRCIVGSHNLTVPSFSHQLEVTFRADIIPGHMDRKNPEFAGLIGDVCDFLGELLKECDRPTGGGRRVAKALQFLHKIRVTCKLNRMRPKVSKRTVSFVASARRCSNGSRNAPCVKVSRSIFAEIERLLNGRLMGIRKKAKPDTAVFVTPFFEQADLRFDNADRSVMERLTLGAPTVKIIGPSQQWVRGKSLDHWIKTNQASGRLTLRTPGRTDDARILHAKCAVWLVGKKAVLYIGSGNLTNHGMMIPPVVGNYEAGVVMSTTRADVNRWINVQFSPASLTGTIGDVVIVPPAKEMGQEACPLYEIILDGTPLRLKLVWADNTRPKRWEIKGVAGVVANEATDLVRLDLQESIGHTVVFRDSELRKEWRVPVVDKAGSPHIIISAFSYAEAIESYKRRIIYAQNLAETDPDVEVNETAGDNDAEVPAVGHEPLAYQLRKYAEDFHVCLEHVRSLPASSYRIWFQRDLPQLLEHLLKKGGRGIVLARMLWHVVSKEARPFDHAVDTQWRKAVLATQPIVKPKLLVKRDKI